MLLDLLSELLNTPTPDNLFGVLVLGCGEIFAFMLFWAIVGRGFAWGFQSSSCACQNNQYPTASEMILARAVAESESASDDDLESSDESEEPGCKGEDDDAESSDDSEKPDYKVEDSDEANSSSGAGEHELPASGTEE